MPASIEDPEDRPATVLLHRIAGGERSAETDLYELLRDELRRLAGSQMDRQGSDHTLQPTALVHEAWMRLVGGATAFEGREHFLAVAARAMRSVLIDHARRRATDKRGGDRLREPLDAAVDAYEASHPLPDLDRALHELADRRPRQAQVVELRFFGGQAMAEIASVLDVSVATVERDWSLARMWLRDRLGPGPDDRG